MLGEANDEQLYAADRITTETKCYTAHGTDCYCHCRFCFVLLLLFFWLVSFVPLLFHFSADSWSKFRKRKNYTKKTRNAQKLDALWMCVFQYFICSNFGCETWKCARARAHTPNVHYANVNACERGRVSALVPRNVNGERKSRKYGERESWMTPHAPSTHRFAHVRFPFLVLRIPENYISWDFLNLY